MATDQSATAEAASDASSDTVTFEDLGLRPELLDALQRLGYEEPTPIQEAAIPLLLERSDVLGQAATGTGKTAAFALPILNSIDRNSPAVPMALVLAPTRELATQVAEAFRNYSRSQGVVVTELVGGQPIGPQLKALSKGVHVVVATPGRAIDHLSRGSLEMDAIATVVLDEADEMLDMGFAEDIELLLSHAPEQKQTVLFSATMPPPIAKIAKTHQTDPKTITVESDTADGDVPLVEQRLYVVKKMHKPNALGRILELEQPRAALVFCRTRTDVDELTVALTSRGLRAEALHGGMDQPQRERVLARLRAGGAQLLVATDVAARGLDIDSLTHVINYDLPTTAESYVHRIGRVGRAGRTGTALSIATPRQHRLVENIERRTGTPIPLHRLPKAELIAERRRERLIEEIRSELTTEDDSSADDLQGVMHALKGEASDRDVALAALRVALATRGVDADTDDVPDASATYEREAQSRRKKPSRGGNDRGRNKRNRDDDRKPRDRGDRPERRERREADPNTGFVYIGVGSRGGIRPGDLVGAIANETSLSGRDIGPIRINDHYSVVGVPDASVDEVIGAIKRSTVKGKKAKARRFEER